jgi:metal-dependent amidase/aminoacylase/carboxypeptidase family protein
MRALTKSRLDVLKKVDKCFEAGADATGAKLKMTVEMGYDNHVPDQALAKVCRAAMHKLGSNIPVPELDLIAGATSASTGQGNISHAMPILNLEFKIESVEGRITPDFQGQRDRGKLTMQRGSLPKL